MTSLPNMLNRPRVIVLIAIIFVALFQCAKDMPFSADNPRDPGGENWHPPAAAFAGGADSINVAINDTVRFHAAGSDQNGQVIGYLWSVDAGRTFTPGDSLFKHVFHAAGRCTVSVEAVDNDSVVSDPDTQFVRIHAYTPSVHISPDDTTIRQNDSLTFIVKATDTNDVSFSFVWTDTALHFNDTTRLHADSTDARRFMFVRNKLYAIAVMAIDAHGQASRPDTAHVLVLGDAPVITSPLDSAMIATPTVQITWVRGFFRQHQRMKIDTGTSTRKIVIDSTLDSTATSFTFRPDNGWKCHARVIGYSPAGDSAASSEVAFSTPAEMPSSNARLRTLTVSAGSLVPSFNRGVYAYADTVDSTMQSVYVYAVPDTNEALVIVNSQYHVGTGSASENVSLGYGTTVVPVVVTAIDGMTQRTYMIAFWRKGGTNADLSALSSYQVTLAPAFNKDTLLYRDTLGTGVSSIAFNFTVADYSATVKVNGNTQNSSPVTVQLVSTIDTTRFQVTAPNKVTTKTYTIITFRRPDTTAFLSNLTSSTGQMTPYFNKDSLTYSDTAAYSDSLYLLTPSPYSISTTVTVNDSPARSGVADSISLHLGINSLIVRTTAQDTSRHRTYTINVFRYGPDTSAYLTNLESATGSMRPWFSTDTLTYRDTVLFAVTRYTVTPTTGSQLMRVTVNDSVVQSGAASRQISLSVGANTITVKIIAQDTSKYRAYSIHVTRLPPSSNAGLDSLVLSAGALTPALDTSVTSYAAYVPNAITSITIKSYPHDTTARVKVNNVDVSNGTASGPINLTVGNNTIIVKVTAQDGTTATTCSLTVERGTPPTEISGIYQTSGTRTLTKAQSPYHVTGAIVVAANGTLIIEPGVVLLMDPGISIDVQGTLIARGAAQDSIYFRAYNRIAGAWGYIAFESSAFASMVDGSLAYMSGSAMEYCVVENGGTSSTKFGAIHADIQLLVNCCSVRGTQGGSSGDVGHGNGFYGATDGQMVLNSVFEGNTGCGINNQGRFTIDSCTVTGNGVNGIIAGNGNGTITGCRIARNTGKGIFSNSCVFVTVTDCQVTDNGDAGIDVHNGAIDTTTVARNRNRGVCMSNGNISACQILNNTSDQNGAGIYLRNYCGNATDTVTGCTIQGNICTGTAIGGGIMVDNYYSTIPYITVSSIDSNVAYNYSAMALKGAGGAGDTGVVSQCTFAGNRTAGTAQPDAAIIGDLYCRFNGNNVVNNTGGYLLGNLGNQGSPNLNATNNYWGPTLTTEDQVRGQIYDFFKDNTKSIVDFMPILTSPAAGAPAIP